VNNDVTELIGNTPLLRLGRIFPNSKIYGKCEFMNPLSLKDRPISQIFKDAEKQEILKPGDTHVMKLG